ncbi:MAG: DUF4837 family protein [Calditrichae bacterium]|nr:DUF4837 family protein [Calditrichota bacterium]MCB9058893.1 DUF4837 family protein [Calditrichia bacterium]
MKKTFKNPGLWLLAFVLLYLNSACDYKRSALGEHQHIFVFADSLLWLDVKDDVQETFYNYIHTPRAERSFTLEWLPLSQLNAVSNRMNFIFIGTTQPGTEVNDYLLKSVPPQFIEKVNNDENFYFFKNDLFMGNQISIFMLAKDATTFKENFSQTKNNIFDQFNAKYLARLEDSMFKQGEQDELEEYLAEHYGYKIRVQHDYFLANQNPDEKYVWLRRIDPDRWISIWRVKNDSLFYNKDSLMQIRNTMTGKYYDGDVVVDDETQLSQVDFLNRQAFKLTGTWRNDSLLVGGPFRMYTIYNAKNDSLYLVDIAVMAPTRDKKPFLDQLEVIASTFKFVVNEKTEK